VLQLHNNIKLTKWKIFVNNDNNLDLEISEENSTDIQELNNNSEDNLEEEEETNNESQTSGWNRLVNEW
jgi:hypothetical protein